LSNLLIDDFSRADGLSALGTAWGCFTDTVMGGRSSGGAERIAIEGGRALRLAGTVSLANNGGFIQVALALRPDGSALDASGFGGIRLRTRGAPGPYFLHLRTCDTIRPWQLYQAPLPVTNDWQTVTVPFGAFVPQRLDRALDLAQLLRLGIVAYGAAFAADVMVTDLQFIAAR
jgi:hypothetical protein